MPTEPTADLTRRVHHTEVRVRFGDTDPYGIVYFVSYFRYCHRAIEDFLRACGLPPEEVLANYRNRDRVEIYRPLTVDPKEARRLRYRSHKAAKAP